MSEFTAVFLLTFLGSICGLLGGLLFLYIPAWSKWLSVYSTPFAAGVLLTTSLAGILPESAHVLGENAYLICLGAFLASFLFEHFFFGLHHHETHEHDTKSYSIPLVLVGDTIHNFVDGVAIAAAYIISPLFGIVTAISTFLHEIPHEIGDFGILFHANWKKGKIILVNVLSAIATFFGAFSIFYFTHDQTFISVLLAISAGIFLYLGASDFLPRVAADSEDRLTPVFVLLAGVVIVLFLLRLLPESDFKLGFGFFDFFS